MYHLFRRTLSRIKRFVVFHLRDKYILRKAIKQSYFALKDTNIKNVLVMCYGNIYRSPFVEHSLRARLSSSHVEIKSAGFHSNTNRPSPERHIQMATTYNIDLIEHRSSKISPELASWADIIVIMDLNNWLLMRKFDETLLSKVVWLGIFKEDDVQIYDPYNKTKEEASVIINELDNCSEKLSTLLNKIASS